MARRSYNQYCTLARSLDIVGERWTLLIVRELMLGPRRFSDLLENLPGIGRNLLTERLRHLEDEGLLRRRSLPPPAASRVYELTEDGRGLGPALAELGRWGARRLEARPGLFFRPAWAMFPFSYMADLTAARGVHETYEFRVEDQAFHLVVDDGDVSPVSGPAADPDLLVTLDGQTLLSLLTGELRPLEALSGGDVEVSGSPAALEHCLAIVAGEPASEAS